MSATKKDDPVLRPVLRDVPMPICTPRLELRPVMPGDGTALNEAKLETWEHLNRWMIWAKDKDTATWETDEAYARTKYAAFILREDITLVGFERASGRMVLFTGLHDPDWDLGHFQIGYWVRQSAQGQGYATEGTNALLRYAFAALDAQRVEIYHAAENKASRRVIEKLVFEREGVKRREAVLPNGEMTDHVMYARLDADGLPDLAVDWGA